MEIDPIFLRAANFAFESCDHDRPDRIASQPGSIAA